MPRTILEVVFHDDAITSVDLNYDEINHPSHPVRASLERAEIGRRNNSNNR